MSDIYLVKEKMHKMRAKLYPSYLPGTEGQYIARTLNEASVTVDNICAAMKNRGDFDGSYEEAVKTIHHFFMETMYQLADGFSANLGYFTIHPNIGGTFANENEIHDHKKHPINFRFQALKPMRDIRDDIEVKIDGIADTKGYIMEFRDVVTGAVNETWTNIGQFVISGYKIKVEGDDPSVGVYFQYVGTGGNTSKVLQIAKNTSSEIIGLHPGLGDGTYKILIKTQYSGGAKPLKEVRTIEAPFTIKRP